MQHDISVQLAKVRGENQEAGSKRPLFTMGSCRLSAPQLQHLEAINAGRQYTAQYVRERCNAMVTPVAPPSAPWTQMLDLMEIEPPKPVVGRPVWLSAMCHSRDFFRPCAIRWMQGDEWRYAKFVFALENPLIVGLCALDLVDRDSVNTFFEFAPPTSTRPGSMRSPSMLPRSSSPTTPTR